MKHVHTQISFSENLFGETVAVDLNERFVGVKLNVRK